jgi:hypothetical protein
MADDLAEQWKAIMDEASRRREEMTSLRQEMDWLKIRLNEREQSLDLRTRIAKLGVEVLFLDAKYDACIIGLTKIASPSGDWLSRLVYDAEKMIQVLIEGGMSLEESLAHVALVQDGCCHGHTPVFVLQI